MSKNNTIMPTRKDFIKSAVCGSVACGSALAAVMPATQARAGEGKSEGPAWDDEADIVVAGSGMVLFGALYAKLAGEDVLVVEKRSELGGTASISGGAVWVPMNEVQDEVFGPDDRQMAIDYIMRMGEGAAPRELVEAFVDGGERFSTWSVDELGFPWSCYAAESFWETYMPLEGCKHGRTLKIQEEFETDASSYVSPIRRGMGMFAWLRDKIEEVGLRTMTETAVRHLVIDEAGAVIGVEAELSSGGTVRIKANKAVVLATGGFDHDQDMLRAYQRTLIANVVAVPENTGDGIKAGMEIGAAVAQMQSNWGAGIWLPVGEEFAIESVAYNDALSSDLVVERAYPHGLIVNRAGVRFVNESANYHTFNRALSGWDAAKMTPCYPGFLIVDADYLERYPLPRTNGEVGIVPDCAVQADTLEELAEICGIDYGNLQWQVEQFNQFAEVGKDPQFHRGENAWDQGRAANEEGLPNPCLGTIARAPFVAMEVWPGTIGTKGGLKTNGNMQVLNLAGDIIPHLYASGGAANCLMGEGYPSAGGCLGNGVVGGFIACEKAAVETPL